MELDGEEEEEYLESECLPLDEETLLHLERNYPGVAGLAIDANNWIEGAGRGIGNSRCLKEVKISVYDCTESGGNNDWLGELCRGIARNRTIESLYFGKDDLSTRDRELIDVDFFRIITPFFKHNCHIRSVEVHDLDLSHTFNSLVSALSKLRDGQLVAISINNVNCSDEQAAAFFDALGNQGFKMHCGFFEEIYFVRCYACDILFELICCIWQTQSIQLESLILPFHLSMRLSLLAFICIDHSKHFIVLDSILEYKCI